MEGKNSNKKDWIGFVAVDFGEKWIRTTITTTTSTKSSCKSTQNIHKHNAYSWKRINSFMFRAQDPSSVYCPSFFSNSFSRFNCCWNNILRALFPFRSFAYALRFGSYLWLFVVIRITIWEWVNEWRKRDETWVEQSRVLTCVCFFHLNGTSISPLLLFVCVKKLCDNFWCLICNTEPTLAFSHILTNNRLPYFTFDFVRVPYIGKKWSIRPPKVSLLLYLFTLDFTRTLAHTHKWVRYGK